MYRCKPLIVTTLVLSGLLFGCKKDHGSAPAAVKLDSFRISLGYPSTQSGPVTDPFQLYELIISETGGRVVLDTVTPYNSQIAVWLKTNQKLLDVTTVRKWATTNNYLIHSYKAIDLTGWITIPEFDSVQAPTGGTALPPPVTGLMTYTHVNVPYGSYYNLLAGGSAQIRQTNDIVAYGMYTASPGDYAYLIFPDLGLYNLHRIVGTNDSVDLSTPGIATKVNFNLPSVYKTASFSLAGYPDPADLSHTVNLAYYNRDGSFITNATSLYYPGSTGFKKYYFSYYASDGLSNISTVVNLPYTDAIPTDLAIPDPGWFNIALTKDTTVTAGFSNHKPTYYDVTSHLGDLQFTLTAPGDSVSLHPVRFYAALHSKLLAGQNIGNMVMDHISIVADAEPNYQAYWAAHTQIYQIWKNPGSANTTFQRHF